MSFATCGACQCNTVLHPKERGHLGGGWNLAKLAIVCLWLSSWGHLRSAIPRFAGLSFFANFSHCLLCSASFDMSTINWSQWSFGLQGIVKCSYIPAGRFLVTATLHKHAVRSRRSIFIFRNIIINYGHRRTLRKHRVQLGFKYGWDPIEYNFLCQRKNK